MDIPLTSIESSMFDGHGYDAATQTLAVRFRGGKTYHFAEVPPEVAQGLVGAESAGRYFGQHIRGKFDGKAVA